MLPSLLRAVALILCLSGLTVLQAGEIPVAWSYRNPLNEIAFPDGVSGGVAFPNTEFQSFAGDQKILATVLSSYSLAQRGEPDVYREHAYEFAVEIRDDASKELARLDFRGILSGELWQTGSDLRNEFRGSTTQTALLGGNLYTVSLVDYLAPQGYGDELAGGITASVRIGSDGEVVTPVEPPTNTTPEPATLMMAFVGLAGTGVIRFRRNRNKAD